MAVVVICRSVCACVGIHVHTDNKIKCGWQRNYSNERASLCAPSNKNKRRPALRKKYTKGPATDAQLYNLTCVPAETVELNAVTHIPIENHDNGNEVQSNLDSGTADGGPRGVDWSQIWRWAWTRHFRFSKYCKEKTRGFIIKAHRWKNQFWT